MDLQQFFQENPRCAIAFSGGVDSAYLLYAGMKYAKEIRAYYVRTAFQPQFELDDAVKLSKELQVSLKVIPADVLSHPEIAANPVNRCYFCKHIIFETIYRAAAEDGFTVLLDGTNASDEEGDRPGMKALRELQVKSPLRLCGLTKDMIRQYSREAGLFTWNKPAYACLATRISSGEPVTKEKLENTEKAEDFLFSLGFTDFRVRLYHGAAMLQFPEEQLEQVLKNRACIEKELKNYYTAVLLDLKTR